MGRCNGAYSGEGGMGKLSKVSDFGNKAPHSIATREHKEACAPWEEDTWKPGPVGNGGGAPKHDSYDLEPVAAASPAGKYAKKGGSGQRSGQ